MGFPGGDQSLGGFLIEQIARAFAGLCLILGEGRQLRLGCQASFAPIDGECRMIQEGHDVAPLRCQSTDPARIEMDTKATSRAAKRGSCRFESGNSQPRA